MMNSNSQSGNDAYLKELGALFIPLDEMENLDRMVDAIGDSDIVLLGNQVMGQLTSIDTGLNFRKS
ncbi:hypothetical protein N6H13_01385 [Paenibacillus sp. CC-CFT742]|nr:hypothetical protein [Paenibacillus sp. CC-CFT742]WJH29476.1 hypothetical protein N6H13_01385 [Paenibacillus sp. CC-CFT742]